MMSRKWNLLQDIAPVTSGEKLTFHNKSMILTVKHGGGGGGVMVWGCFAASGPG